MKDKKKIIIVDENDIVIGEKGRGTLQAGDIYQASALWVTNSKGDLLLRKKRICKKHYPGMCGPAVAGTNDEGETSESNIIKETEEEIGVSDSVPHKVKKVRVSGGHNHFTQWFSLVLDKDVSELIKQDDEVEELRWFSKEELGKGFKNRPDDFLEEINEDFLLEI